MEAVELRGRSVLVTGGHGLLGAWLIKALLQQGARVVAIRRDEPAASTLVMLGLAGHVDAVHGDICEDGLIARALDEYEVDSVFHLAAQTLVGTANRSPLSTFETNIRGTWLVLEACRLHGVRSVIVACSDKAYGPPGRAALQRATGADPDVPLRRLQGGRRPARPVLLAHLRAAGRRYPLRQPVRRR